MNEKEQIFHRSDFRGYVVDAKFIPTTGSQASSFGQVNLLGSTLLTVVDRLQQPMTLENHIKDCGMSLDVFSRPINEPISVPILKFLDGFTMVAVVGFLQDRFGNCLSATDKFGVSAMTQNL